MIRTRGATWWTLSEVQDYLGHGRQESTEVWLTRHGVQATRLYRVRDIKTIRERPTPGLRREAG